MPKEIKKAQPTLSPIQYIDKKAQIPSRLIIYPVDKPTYERRMRKTKKQAKSCEHQVSDAYMTRVRLTTHVTNGDKNAARKQN